MKNLKKLPTKQLEKFSNIFTQLGLVLVLFVVYLFLEHKTEQQSVAVLDPPTTSNVLDEHLSTEIIFTKELKPKLNVPKSNPFIPDEPIEKGDDNIIEKVIDFHEEDDAKQLDIDILFTEEEPEDEFLETLPYIVIENTPIFKGCEGLSEEENRKCFDKKMIRFIQRNFDSQLANEVGLNSGKYRIFTEFIINENGNVVDVIINAPHIKLKKETQQLIKKLPKFTPGKQRNKAVKVKYALPITFHVE
jgi:protein TonB